jgi:hypothetical protein
VDAANSFLCPGFSFVACLLCDPTALFDLSAIHLLDTSSMCHVLIKVKVIIVCTCMYALTSCGAPTLMSQSKSCIISIEVALWVSKRFDGYRRDLMGIKEI